ncbi:DUF1573 domain-containing protein [Pontibacter sp. HSC-14F20]|uniref:DUF1573 domain-containing protein n=1 Tax=Pontibacter sp. HSC-14F20 TaxID=2864136 RepID=UPI001C731398|nr:DUF1573 domain-containing protein [Pontibacter sp. HSC-14F20]MBX0331996.1 DUF1573 domain-containing protein [Pontibacter sp. HSC-14F20]
MKKLILSFAMAALVAGGAVAQGPAKQTAAPQAQAKSGPAISFESTEHNFGEITQGDVVEHTFTFTNTGTQPLIIDRVDVTCGCTSPDWTKEAVMPGKTGFVKAKYNSAGRMGQQKKAITIHSNTGEPTYVYIVTNIKEKSASAAKAQ